MVFERSDVPEFLGGSATAGSLSAEPVTSVPAGKVLKMCCEIVGGRGGEFGIFGDVSVSGGPTPDPGSWECLAEVDSFVYPFGGWVEGDTEGVVVDSN